jgi:hypothetical protein
MPYLYTDKYISQLNNSHSAATTVGNRNSQQNNFPDRDIYFSELLDKQCLYIYNIGNIKKKGEVHDQTLVARKFSQYWFWSGVA